MELPRENAHAPNEFINLENFFGGINTSAHFLYVLPLRHRLRGGSWTFPGLVIWTASGSGGITGRCASGQFPANVGSP